MIEAPAVVFEDQEVLLTAFERGELNKDFVAVARFQGPKTNSRPELRSLTPPLGVLLDGGVKVSLVTDGGMSGTSGKMAAAIHLTPEVADGGPLAYVRNGDIIRRDAEAVRLEIKLDLAELRRRKPAITLGSTPGHCREMFGLMRRAVGPADGGTCALFEAA